MASPIPDPSPIDSRPPYEYIPFPYPNQSSELIRLLTLLPGDGDSEICCELEHASLTSPPPYEALSYTWGNPKGPKNSIPCRGDPDALFDISIGERRQSVGYNLMCALKQLRHPKNARTLWVDALCINQTDDNEKSDQVGMMAIIYRRASQVIAWLGEEDEFTDLAFDTVEEFAWATKAVFWRHCAKKLNKLISTTAKADVLSIIDSEQSLRRLHKAYGGPQNLIEAFTLVPSPVLLSSENLEDAVIATFGKTRGFARCLVSNKENSSRHIPDAQFAQHINALAETFLRRSYWTRLWVIQELVAGSKVNLMSGSRQLDLRIFLVATWSPPALASPIENSTFFEYLNPEKMSGLFMSMSKIATAIYSKCTETLSLAELLIRCFNLICSEPRDNIYGLLQIAQPIDLKVDYHLPPGDIFAQATKQIIQQERNLGIILLKPETDQEYCPKYTTPIDLPSWVPRFETFLKFSSFYGFSAGGALPKSFDGIKANNNSKTLRLQGYYYIENIRQTFPGYDFSDGSLRGVWETVLRLKQHLGISKSKWRSLKHSLTPKRYREIFNPIEAWDLFWNTLAMDQYRGTGLSAWARMSSNADVKQLCEEHIRQALARGSEPPKRLLDVLEYSLDGKVFVMLDSGYPALVDGDPEPGDKLFIAHGSQAPLVIRPVVSQPNIGNSKIVDDIPKYTLVGGAYVHEMMDGLFIKLAEENNLPEVQIDLV